jgi:hypothetical protein
VRAIVRAELPRDGGAQDSDALQRITTRLQKGLSKLIGSAGFDVLLARSILLARRAHPALAGVTAGPGGVLACGDNAARDGVALQDRAVEIVSQFVELLASLVGEDLAMDLVRGIWPEAAEKETK